MTRYDAVCCAAFGVIFGVTMTKKRTRFMTHFRFCPPKRMDTVVTTRTWNFPDPQSKNLGAGLRDYMYTAQLTRVHAWRAHTDG